VPGFNDLFTNIGGIEIWSKIKLFHAYTQLLEDDVYIYLYKEILTL